MTTCHHTPAGPMLRSHRPDCDDRDCGGCQPCRHDQHGNPVRHCGLRRHCTSHLTDGEHACPACLATTRRNLDRIDQAMAEMPNEAIHTGIDSTPADLAGPAANVVVAEHRRRDTARHGGTPEATDWTDPRIALGQWERAIREDLGHDGTTLVSDHLGQTCRYLDWVLTDLARDEHQRIVLADLLADTAALAGRLESILRDSRRPEEGAPCPRCPSTPDQGAPRLRLRHAHWCEYPDCDREHDTTGARDTWICPADRDHWWREAEYRRWVSDDYVDNATRLTADQLENRYGIPAGSVRAWATRGELDRCGRDQRGRTLYDVDQARAKARTARPRRSA